MPQHVTVDAVRPETRIVGVDDVSRRVALIHAELWLADDTEDDSRAALEVASAALDHLLADVDDVGAIADELTDARAIAAGHLDGAIDLRDGIGLDDQRDVRRGRARVEARLSSLLLALLGLPSASG